MSNMTFGQLQHAAVITISPLRREPADSLSANLELIRQTASLSLQGAKVASLVEGLQLVACSFHNLWHSHTHILVISDTPHS